MLFNSIEFILFFGVFYIGFLMLRQSWTLCKAYLLAASYVFYMAWNPILIFIIWGSTVLDYVAAKRIVDASSTRTKKLWVAISCTGNLGVLFFFKYADFLTSQVWIFFPKGVQYPAWLDELVLPIGISFYTFQSMSYTIDVYRNEKLRTNNLLDFALYVTFFPQLIAGPILRSAQFLPQLLTKRTISPTQVNDGITYILRGLAKKIIFADTLALYVDPVFASPGDFGAVNIWFALYAYTYQIYFDFSGYSDIAIGLGKLMGFNMPKNFNLPYLSRNPSDYWNRWHISLSTWLRDYLYFSMGGSKSSSNFRIYRNLFLTMMLGGIWHGASWGIFIWGIFHGLWLIIHRIMFREHKLIKVPDLVARVATFHLLCIGFLFFRSESFRSIPVLLLGLFDHTSEIYAIPLEILFVFVLGVISHLLGGVKSLQQGWVNIWPEFRGLAYALIVFGIWISTKEAQNFIYFQF